MYNCFSEDIRSFKFGAESLTLLPENFGEKSVFLVKYWLRYKCLCNIELFGLYEPVF